MSVNGSNCKKNVAEGSKKKRPKAKKLSLMVVRKIDNSKKIVANGSKKK